MPFPLAPSLPSPPSSSLRTAEDSLFKVVPISWKAPKEGETISSFSITRSIDDKDCLKKVRDRDGTGLKVGMRQGRDDKDCLNKKKVRDGTGRD